MPDYFTVEPDYTRLMNKHFTSGRGGRKIKYIVRHHNAGISTTDATWNTWQTRQASAHYQIETNGRVGQLVYDGDTAWANGNQTANQESITIEHSNIAGASQDWPISDATIESGAKWVAALCWFYELGRPEFGVNVRDHRNFYATSCPHRLAFGGDYHDRYMRIAQEHYDWMSGAATVPAINEIDAEAQRAKLWIGNRITDGELTAPDGKGKYAQFEYGYIYFHPEVCSDRQSGSRAFAIPIHVFETWSGLDWEAGVLGYPTERHTVIDGVGDIQAFQGGVLYRKYGQGGFYITGLIWDRFASNGFEVENGWPTSNERDHDGGRIQSFEKTDMVYHPNAVVRIRKEP